MKITAALWQEMVKILNVAEKNDAAKSIAALLSRGTSRMVSTNFSQTHILSISMFYSDLVYN